MRRYAKPLVVADDLTLLRGATTGVVTLPRHLDWSGSADYDLDSPGRLVDFYRTVLIEATKPADLHTYLDQATLTRLWASVWLPPDLRKAWEERFPQLRRTDSASDRRIVSPAWIRITAGWPRSHSRPPAANMAWP